MDRIKISEEDLRRSLKGDKTINYESAGSRWTTCTFCTSESLLIKLPKFKDIKIKGKNKQRGEKL